MIPEWRSTPTGDEEDLRAFFDAIDPHRRPHRPRTIESIGAHSLAWILMVAAWPVGILLFVGQFIADYLDENDREFAVGSGDLLEPLSVEEIEQRERIFDPLGAVPDLPFGHLNAAWRKLLRGRKPRDEIWAFSAHRASTLKGKELRQGYVIVRRGSIGPQILTIRATLEDN